jgi:hypothetical protein
VTHVGCPREEQCQSRSQTAVQSSSPYVPELPPKSSSPHSSARTGRSTGPIDNYTSGTLNTYCNKIRRNLTGRIPLWSLRVHIAGGKATTVGKKVAEPRGHDRVRAWAERRAGACSAGSPIGSQVRQCATVVCGSGLLWPFVTLDPACEPATRPGSTPTTLRTHSLESAPSVAGM